MTKSKLSLKPQCVNKDTWYYENEKNLEIIHYDKLREFHSIKIPIKKIIKSLERYGYGFIIRRSK